MRCKACWPPYPLTKSGWEDPEYYCRRCKRYFNADREQQPAPEIKETPKGLIVDSDELEELNDWLYGGTW